MSARTIKESRDMQRIITRMELENQLGSLGFVALCALSFWYFQPLFGYAEWAIMGLFALGSAAIVLQLRKLRIDVLRASLQSPPRRPLDDYTDLQALAAIRSAR